MRIPKIGFGLAAGAIALTAITTLAPADSMDDQGFSAQSYSAGFSARSHSFGFNSSDQVFICYVTAHYSDTGLVYVEVICG